jgi:hypothetical protein
MPAAASSNGISEDIINRALGEAHCIRGIAYYWLTEYWQDVPIITNNNISGDQVIRHKQASVYEFIRQDLEFAKDNLPATSFKAGRCSKYTAIGMLAKLHLTMASHLTDAASADNFAKAKAYAAEVINNSGLELSDLSTMFYPAGNNCSETLFAIQCTTDGYGYGNGHNVSLSRSALINNGSSWGAGKGPTLSLQETFESNDLRRKYTFMRNGDTYNNLAGGGYTYVNFYPESDATETPNEMLAHVRKYIIGANSDCGGKAGATNQDAGNNIYLLRLADVYLCYVEACIGSGSSTSDALALDVFGRVRARAGLGTSATAITYDQLIRERRVEFALEGVNFFDIKRMSYRDMSKALAYLTGMERQRQYVSNNGNYTNAEKNASGAYHGGFTSLHPDDDTSADKKGSIFYLNKDVATITFTEKNLVLPIPAETITKTPTITKEPVDYDF